MHPTQWSFSNNRHGRPEIANPEVGSLRLMFNISHTPNLIAMGVTKSRGLGIDVENVFARSTSSSKS
jgi:phosphopantetheinyl transferase